jgi:hypothetical protein
MMKRSASPHAEALFLSKNHENEALLSSTTNREGIPTRSAVTFMEAALITLSDAAVS